MVVRGTLLLALALAAPRGVLAQDKPRDVLGEVVDSVARVAGWPSLEHAPKIPAADLEIRAYIGFGIVAPEHLVRVRRHGNVTEGQLLLYWHGARSLFFSPDSTIEAQNRKWVARVRAEARTRGCADIRRTPTFEACVVTPRNPVNWVAALSELQSAGITRLSQPQGGGGVDGTTLFVEVREGDRYRRYSYWTPSAKAAGADERAASRIMDALLALYKRAGF